MNLFETRAEIPFVKPKTVMPISTLLFGSTIR